MYITTDTSIQASREMTKFAYPTRKTSATFRKAEFISIGKGYFSNSSGYLTIASHCSPTLPDRSPIQKQAHFCKQR